MPNSQSQDLYEPRLLGCDEAAQEVFRRSWQPVQEFLIKHLGAGSDWNDMPSYQTRKSLYDHFVKLEQQICQSSSRDATARRKGRRKWLESYLAPLAEQLGLVEKAWQTTIRLCWLRGCFDFLEADGRRRSRPRLQDIFVMVHALIQDRDTSKRQITVLVERKLCSDRQSAQIVVKKLSLVKERAANQARALLLAGLEYGWIGLLRYSKYACADELCLVQSYADYITRLSDRSYDALGSLRADIIALYHTLHSIEPQLRLWKQNLLHEPPGSALREVYRQGISPELLARVVAELSQRRDCSETEATTLFSTFVTSGLPGLIGWRCSTDGTALQGTLAVIRIEEAIGQYLGALVPAAQQEIAHLLVHLSDAAAEVQVPLPIVSLLSQNPSSRYRVRIGRRLSFGFASMLRRRRRPYRPGRKSAIRKRRVFKRTPQPGTVSAEDQLIAAFARRAGLPTDDNNKEARSRLRYFLTYGGIGMLPKEDWSTLADWASLIDPRLVSYIYFFKLGKPDGALDRTLMLQRLKAYAKSLGTAAPSLQLTKAIFNSLSKPPRWHGGEGEFGGACSTACNLDPRCPATTRNLGRSAA